jgi:VanZ family protein
MALIFYLSAQHAGAELHWYAVIARKLGHLGGYALLTVLWAWALSGATRRPLVWAAAISFLYACSDEFHQSFVDTRHATPVDVLIDSAGIGLAVIAMHICRRPEVAKTEQFKDAGRSPKRAC